MTADREERSRIETAYRRARWVIIGHAIFLGVACLVAMLLRRAGGLPQIYLFTIVTVALMVFGGDIMKLLHYRNELRRLRDADPSS